MLHLIIKVPFNNDKAIMCNRVTLILGLDPALSLGLALLYVYPPA